MKTPNGTQSIVSPHKCYRELPAHGPLSQCRRHANTLFCDVENDRRDEDAEVRSDLVLAHVDSNLELLFSPPEQ